jgi:hypothetical protein
MVASFGLPHSVYMYSNNRTRLHQGDWQSQPPQCYLRSLRRRAEAIYSKRSAGPQSNVGLRRDLLGIFSLLGGRSLLGCSLDGLLGGRSLLGCSLDGLLGGRSLLGCCLDGLLGGRSHGDLTKT